MTKAEILARRAALLAELLELDTRLAVLAVPRSCGAVADGFTCTQVLGHEGDHVAQVRRVAHTWPRQAGDTTRPQRQVVAAPPDAVDA